MVRCLGGERNGLIFSTRDSGNQRRYARDTLRRVAFIRGHNELASRSPTSAQPSTDSPGNAPRTPTTGPNSPNNGGSASTKESTNSPVSATTSPTASAAAASHSPPATSPTATTLCRAKDPAHAASSPAPHAPHLQHLPARPKAEVPRVRTATSVASASRPVLSGRHPVLRRALAGRAGTVSGRRIRRLHPMNFRSFVTATRPTVVGQTHPVRGCSKENVQAPH